MMASLRLLLCVAACLAVALAGDHRAPSNPVINEHSLRKPFLDRSMSIPNWEFSGNTIVSDDFVRLTPDRQSKRGQLFNTRPFRGNEWEVTFKFKVHGQGEKLFGDGFAFWYTRNRNQPGPVFGAEDHFVGLGVFFDTYSNQQHHNHGHPYISALVNDGSVDYDHDADGTHQEVSGCQSFFRNQDFDTYVRVTYSGPVQRLTVKVDAKNNNEWEECFTVEEVFLPPGFYFGFSAATGDLADNHDILEVLVSEAPEAPKLEEVVANLHKPADDEKPFAKHHAPEREHIHEEKRSHHAPATEASSGGSWFLTIIFVVLVAAGGAGGYYYFVVQRKQKESRFKF